MTRAASALAWGLFCACSWTWCIGMFLPRVMVERYGPLGFVVFAVPNVVGCALMGYVVRSPAASRYLVERHAAAIAAFSLVTIAYHMYFIGWIFDAVLPLGVPSYLIALVILGLAMASGRLGNAAWAGLAAAVYLVSLVAFARLAGAGPVQLVVEDPTRPVTDVLWLSPAIVAGFLCSPYLDATFHRARQCSESRHAFGVFGVTFGAMLVMSLFVWLRGDAPMPAIVVAHLLAQATFTVGAHARELRGLTPMRCRIRRNTWLVVMGAAAFVYPLGGGWLAWLDGQDVYLRFLVAYGLLAPAYVLVFIGPMRPAARSRGALVAWAIMITAAVPMYELAFIGTTAWIMVVPGLAAVAWLATRFGRPRVRSSAWP